MSDRLTAVALLAGCGFFYWQSTLIRRPGFAQFESFDASTFPRAVLAVLAVFALVLLARGGGPLIPRLTREGFRRWLDRYRVALMSLALFAAYVLVMPLVGWTLSTVGYLVTMQLAILPRRGRRDLALVVVGSLVFTIALGTGFERFLHIVLPRPELF